MLSIYTMILTQEKIRTITAWVIALIVPPVIILPVYFLTDFGLSNICAILAVLLLAYVSLTWVGRMGTFDIFRYQFGRFIDSFKRGMPKRYEDAYSYKQAMADKRKEHRFIWIPYLASGLILLVLGIIFAVNPM